MSKKEKEEKDKEENLKGESLELSGEIVKDVDKNEAGPAQSQSTQEDGNVAKIRELHGKMDEAMKGRLESDIPMNDDYWKYRSALQGLSK